MSTHCVHGVHTLVRTLKATKVLSEVASVPINFESIPEVAQFLRNCEVYRIHHFNIRYTPSTPDIRLVPVNNWAEFQLHVEEGRDNNSSGNTLAYGLSFNLKYTSPPFYLYKTITHRKFRRANSTKIDVPKFPKVTLKVRNYGADLAEAGVIKLEYIVAKPEVPGEDEPPTGPPIRPIGPE